MKSILLSIKPKWVAKIMNGDKTIEVRKNKALYKATKKLIEEQGYATFFMYCTKDKKDYLIDYRNANGKFCLTPTDDLSLLKEGITQKLNGKVVAKFTVRKVEELRIKQGIGWATDTIKGTKEIEQVSCVSRFDLYQYCKGFAYAYHIEDLVIFDKPRELKEFWHYKKETNCGFCIIRSYSDKKHRKPRKLLVPLTKAPQNFCYVQSEE